MINAEAVQDESTEELTEAERNKRLDMIGLVLAETRTEAIRGREQSHIEKQWREDEEHYEGIDEYNRGEWDTKPPGQATPSKKPTGSTVFANITRPYSDAAASRIGDMLLPTDDRAFSMKNTPLPDLVAIAKGEVPERIRGQIASDPRLQTDAQGNPLPEDEHQALVEQTTGELVEKTKKEVDEAADKAKKAETRIDDWLVECQYHSHVRDVIDDCAKVGCGILKGPVPEHRKTVAFKDGKLVIQDDIIPVSRRISYWNFFPDPDSGENIHRGNYTWERDDITEKELHSLLGGEYIDSQIMEVLREGPQQAVSEWDADQQWTGRGLKARDKSKLFEIWYYHGLMSKDQVEAAGCECGEDEYINVQVTMVNNRMIKAALNHLDTGEFPYDVMIWQKKAGSPWGIGIARQIRVPQKILNAALRNLMDNAGLAGKPMWIALRGLVEPIDGVWELAPGKGWDVGEDANFDDVKKAFQFITIPMMQKELQSLLEMAMKMGEDITGMPMLLQGQQGAAPDTVGGMQLMNNNASTVLRRLARLYDDKVTEPHIRRFYSYLLQYGEDDEKGDFQIDARGSSALVEREIQTQGIMQMGALAANPMYGIDPKKWADEMLKSQRLNSKQFMFDDDEWQEIVQKMAQPPEQQDSRLQVAQLNAELKQAEWQHEAQQADQKRQFEAQQKEQALETEMFFKQLDAELAQEQQAGKAQIDLAQLRQRYQEHQETLKTKLAETAMKLRTQKDLNGTEVLTPPVEPRGRAPDGMSFQR